MTVVAVTSVDGTNVAVVVGGGVDVAVVVELEVIEVGEVAVEVVEVVEAVVVVEKKKNLRSGFLLQNWVVWSKKDSFALWKKFTCIHFQSKNFRSSIPF